jgi:hypothetical protein
MQLGVSWLLLHRDAIVLSWKTLPEGTWFPSPASNQADGLSLGEAGFNDSLLDAGHFIAHAPRLPGHLIQI